MGIQMLSTPTSDVDAGIFNLPPSLDTKKFAVQWKLKGLEVDKAMQRQSLLGTRLSADGWEVYKVEGKPVMRAATKGEYVLMFRPREVQDAVNAVYGNVGLERMTDHLRGATTGGVPLESGILTAAEVAKVTGERAEQDGEVKFNAVALDDKPIEVAPLQTTGNKKT